MTKLIVIFRNFANVPKMIVRIKYRRIYKYSLIQGVKTGRICTQDFVSMNKMEKNKTNL